RCLKRASPCFWPRYRFNSASDASHDVEVVLGDGPVGIDLADREIGELLPAIHLPQIDHAGVVAPQDVGLAVAVVVGDRLDVPVGRNLVEVDVGDLGPAVHLPQGGLAVARAPPEDVGHAVAIEVTGALHAPFGGDGAEVDVELLHAAVHFPQHGLSIAGATPQDVA